MERAEILDHTPFTQDFFWKRPGCGNADGLIIVDAHGDSMEPTIYDGDLIMIDMNQRHNLTAAIYVFTYEEHFFVKRLNITLGTIEVISDNPAYPPFTVDGDKMEWINILGRVVWIGHTP